jgi:hypothetical protein
MEIDNVCIADNGAYTQGINQVSMQTTEMSGSAGRLITHALSQYRRENIFWNVKGTPNGKWLIVQSPFLGSQRSDALLAKTGTFPSADSVARNGFISTNITIPTYSGAQTAVVQFGYTPSFYCTSRNEACLKGTETGNNYAFASEGSTGVSCASGCTISVPAIPQRVLYYRAEYRDAGGSPIGYSDMGAVGIDGLTDPITIAVQNITGTALLSGTMKLQ